MSSWAEKGDAALASSSYLDAIEHYTHAIQEIPTSPDYHIKRSAAHHKAKQYPEALKDAERAITLADQRGKKDTRAQAQFRRSLALHQLGHNKAALTCLEAAERDGCKEKAIPTWRARIGAASSDEPYDLNIDQEKEKPHIPLPAPPVSVKKPTFEWYQNDQDVIITFYAKNVKQDSCSVQFSPRSLEVEFPLPGGSEYSHSFECLHAEILPSESSFRVLSTKVEVTLRKGQTGRWPTIESSEPVEYKIAYPTSSRSGPKNWEQLGTTVEEDKKEGDAALTELFQTLYKDADEDTRKAMVKSYTESGGTSLSTDWKSVKNGRVEVKPPEGMEARKYEQ